MRAHHAALLGFAVACGRIGYDELVHEEPDAADVDADLADAEEPDADDTDAPLAACPSGSLPLCTDSPVCIDIDERGYTTWDDAGAQCGSAGGRLCADAEWALACSCEPLLTEMYADGSGSAREWEWLLEESGGIAWKRGYDTCDSTSTHAVTDFYDFRCCYDR